LEGCVNIAKKFSRRGKIRFMAEEKKLNKEQKEAVGFRDGPLLIIAGAGTGKTTVVTERIKRLISKGLAKPQEILALTFTEKAALEMETRVDEIMPYGYTQMWIMTFHSFCDRVLRADALHVGLDPRYKLMTEADAIALIRRNLFKLELEYFRPLGNPTKFVSGILQHFSRLQDEDVDPSDYLTWVNSNFQIPNSKLSQEQRVEGNKYRELANTYRKYEELKIKEGVMDFGDLITKTLKLFRDRPNVLKQYKSKFKYVLVDEYQDTNISQNELVKLLVGKEGNITVVADDDQAIYRWRGASISNVIQFRKSFPETHVVTLTKNYRSTQKILDKAYQLIQNNNPDRLEVVEKIGKKLVSQVDKNGEDINFIHRDRIENEADSVAKEVIQLIKLQKYDYKDIAVLVRANNHADAFARAFAWQGIPYQFLGPGRLFRQSEVVDLVSYLRVLYNFEDSVSFYRVLSIDYFDILARDLAKIGNYAKRYNLSLFETVEKIDEVSVGEETKEKLKKIMLLINKHLKLVRRETTGQILYYFLQDSGLLQNLINPQSPEAEKQAKNISKFFDKLKNYEAEHEDATIPAVVDWLDLSTELGESPLAADTDRPEVDAVNILTVHGSKGLEFPVVFLVNLVGQRFPSTERQEQIPIPEELIKEILPQGDFHLQEERRLFYVGMTRARERLYFSAADYYGEGKREKKLSPFIFEALGDEAIASEPFGDAQGKQLSFLDYEPTNHQSLITNHRQNFHIDYLSYSQIETFKVCPLHYKLGYILRIPTPLSASQSFGTSIHTTLKYFYEQVKNGSKSAEKLLLDIYKDSWVKEGYTSREHEKKFFEKGKDYLKGYFNVEFDSKVLPALLEQRFTIPLAEESERPLKIGGVIDRVDEHEDGSVEIIDYKTGANIPSQKEVDSNLQMTFYALAAVMLQDNPFNKDPKDIALSLYFLDNQQKISTRKTKEQLQSAIKEIFEIRKEIEQSNFTCSGHMFCRNCEYKLMCNIDN